MTNIPLILWYRETCWPYENVSDDLADFLVLLCILYRFWQLICVGWYNFKKPLNIGNFPFAFFYLTYLKHEIVICRTEHLVFCLGIEFCLRIQMFLTICYCSLTIFKFCLKDGWISLIKNKSCCQLLHTLF